MEHPEVTSKCGWIITGGQAADRGKIGLVHELGGGDAASRHPGEVKEAARLIRRPDAAGVAVAVADCK